MIGSDKDPVFAQIKSVGGPAETTGAGSDAPPPVATGVLPTPPAGAVAAPSSNGVKAGGPLVAVPAAAQPYQAAATPGSTFYRIGPQDVIEISVFKVPDLSRVVQVADLGTVNLPLVGETQAVGRTAQEMERELTGKLGGKYLQNPQVNVFIREYNSQRVTVEGAVKKQGIYPIRGKLTLLQLIAQCEGVNTDIADEEVLVFRVREGKKTAAKFNIAAIRTGTLDDPLLQAGDVVVVTTNDMKVAFNSFLKALPAASFALTTAAVIP